MGHTQETICWIASAFERSTTLLSTWHQRLMFYVSLCLFRIEINGRQKQNQQHVSLRSQNSFPLHLARHAVASTDRVFFEPHARAKGSPPPAVSWSSRMALRARSVPCVGGAFVCKSEQIQTARPQRARSRDGWMFGEWDLALLIYAL